MTSKEHKQKHEVGCVEGKPYLVDVQVGDKLYNFLESNKRYTVRNINHEDSNNSLYPIQVVGEDKFTINISKNGTKYLSEKVPYFLYAPVDVLDPKNLPPRPWKPRKGEWVWAWNNIHKNGRILVRFVREDGQLYVSEDWQDRDIRMIRHWENIAPFKGELPPRLEEER